MGKTDGDETGRQTMESHVEKERGGSGRSNANKDRRTECRETKREGMVGG